MLYETASQALEAPLMMLAGMVMAGASLFFHMIRHLICAGRWLSLVCDILMGVVWSVIFCGALIMANRGSLRLYHILSAGAGTALFHAALDVPVRSICGKACMRWRDICRRIRQSRAMQVLLK